ncbi:MAG: type II toxin-antitoxin system HicA family toxin [Candidatus Absconditabacteria bacterium]|nr:type II toxin-antitoxin system HicA family toxin [Candidatus Absconditabacteria bacterium]MDD3262226.1 type II toxin-antitoxin system HicA family toxin [Candidatus Absconditabacteria bacterium]
MPYKFRDIERRLRKLGFDIVRQKGSHVIFSDGKITFPVPNHGGKDISPGVEKKILEFISKNKQDFDKILDI